MFVFSIYTPIRAFESFLLFFLIIPRPPRPTLFPYTTLFRSTLRGGLPRPGRARAAHAASGRPRRRVDRKSTRLNSSHGSSSYAGFCWNKEKSRHAAPALLRDAPRVGGGTRWW